MHWCAIVCPQSDGVSHPQFPGSKHGFHDYDHNFWTLGLPVSLNQVAPTLSLIWPVRNSSFLSKFQGLIFGSTRYTNSVQFYSAPRFVFVKTMACQLQQPSDVQAESTTPGHIHMPPRKKGLEKSKKRKECKNLIYDLLIKILRAMLGGVGWPGLVSGVWICGCCFNFSRGLDPCSNCQCQGTRAHMRTALRKSWSAGKLAKFPGTLLQSSWIPTMTMR